MLAAWVPCLRALDPGKSIFQFNCQSWTRAGGLPADRVSAIAQTRDGYIWLGGQNGLVRFDGQEFKSVAIDLAEAHGQDIDSISQAKDGKLWFSVSAGGYGSFDGRTFAAIGDTRWAAKNISAQAILAADGGEIWTGSVAGWGRWVKGKPDETLLRDTHFAIFGLWQGKGDRIWMGTADEGLFFWSEGEFKPFPDPDLSKAYINSVVEDRAGDIWVATMRGLYRYDAQFRRKESFWPGIPTSVLLVDGHGVLWAGTDGLGLERYQDGRFTVLGKADGLASDSVTALLEDREGSLWVGTRDGLSQLTDLKFPLYTEKEGLVGGSVIAVAASPRGGLWIASTGGASYFDGHTAKNFQQIGSIPGFVRRRVYEARNGDVYFADGERNLIVMSSDQPPKVFAGDRWPESITEDRTSVLVALGPLLTRVIGGRIEPYTYEGAPPNLNWINYLCVAKDEAIWACTNNGLFRIKDGKFRHWTTAEGLSSAQVLFAMEDVDGSIWVGTPSGLVRVKDGHVSGVGVTEGLPDPRIYAIASDGLGYFWLDSGRGLLRVARQELVDLADGKKKHVNCQAFDGLESFKFIDRTVQAYSACKTTDGRLWFPNTHGVMMVDPGAYFINHLAPVVSVQKVLAHGRDVSVRPSTLDPGDGSVEFFFSALSFIAPRKVEVRYQLEGFDPAWVDAGSRRAVTYNNLRAGHYTFRVKAANADGVWSTVVEEFSFVLPPPFYQRPWFYAFGAVAAGLGLFGVYRVGAWQLRSRQKKLQAEYDLLELKVAKRTDELARSLSVLRATLDSTADGIVVEDTKGAVSSYNTRFLAIWRLPPTKIAGEEDRILLLVAEQVRDRPAFLAKLHELRRQPEAESHEILELKDGRVIERDSLPQRLNGVCVGRVWCFRDITERKRAEGELQQKTVFLEAQVNSTIDGILVVDQNGRKALQNKRTTELFKIPPAIADSEDDASQVRWVTNRVKNPALFLEKVAHLNLHRDEISRDEIELVDGTVLDRYSAPVVGRAGRYFGRIWTFRDITENKRSQAELEDIHRKLVDASRRGGMAEIATNVLHNVGNVLNSVNVSTGLIVEKMKKSRADSLARVVALLSEHGDDLAAFITTDARGKNLPAYLAQLSDQLRADQESVASEVDSLRRNVDHIKEIVAMQQTYARFGGVNETINLTDLMEEGLRLNEGGFNLLSVQVVREFEPTPPVNVEKHKVLQILVNLLRNAKHACQESDRADRRLTVRCSAGAGRIRISVIDNGVGIPPENLTRIFSHGFTTRPSGHGFGLHSSVLAATEMGGSLTVHSEGPGLGAAFTLELPLSTTGGSP